MPTLSQVAKMIPNSAEQCCERDHNHDGNCDHHPNGVRPLFRPGDHMHHAISYAHTTRWVGMVLEVETVRGIGWERTVVRVRWLKDSGDPSDDTTTHAPEELRHAERE